MSSIELLRRLYDYNGEERLNRFPNTGDGRIHNLNPGRVCIVPEISAKAIVVKDPHGGAVPFIVGQMTIGEQKMNVVGAAYYHSPEDRGKLSQAHEALELLGELSSKYSGELDITSYLYLGRGIDKRIKKIVEEEADELGIRFKFKISKVDELFIATAGWFSQTVPVEVKMEMVAYNDCLRAEEESVLYGINPQQDYRSIYEQRMREADAKLDELERSAGTFLGRAFAFLERRRG